MTDARPKDDSAEPGCFNSILRARAHEARDLTRTCGVVPLIVIVHVLLLIGLNACWQGASHSTRDTPRETALVLRLLASAPPPPAPAGTATASAPQRAKARKARPFPNPRLTQLPPTTSFPDEDPPGATELEEPSSETPDGAADGVTGGVKGGVTGGVIGGLLSNVLAASSAGLLPVVMPAPSSDEPTDDEKDYLRRMFRDRFEDLPYPEAAEAAGIEGIVPLRITVGARGQLLGLSMAGACPHALLCDAAMKAVREEAPFPPPPRALGSRVSVVLPFRYRIIH
ncbi:TonB family protein [Myxococcus stipitatus DSM 14675]|uniref:TonB family protein n=1 Tax=Myxococcus stipitatus (strain DSM 14675 / JCM 12634 / Mx s8) TaxID=1278073 RepID=L7U628_MYXSD|nr:energy transducer TonB [Myxococcus stipitatus]AGC41909.1 TonB family protein [Myxococcus stipitatus DSM 14675]